MQNFLKKNVLGIFIEIDINFSYGIGITKLLARCKHYNEGYVMTESRVYLGMCTIYLSYDIHKGMIHSSGFLL